jgi:retron-type reverse transcriptase
MLNTIIYHNKTELTPISTRVTVTINNAHTEEFKLESGVNQGDFLSAVLFSVAVDVIFKQLDFRGNTSTHVKQCAVYADDTLVTTRTKQQ